MDTKLIKDASQKGILFYEKFGPSEGNCDACRKRGWSYLVAIIENESEVGGHIQNAEHVWSLGPECFNKLSQNLEVKPFRSTG